MTNETIGCINDLFPSQEVRYVETETELRVVSDLDASVYLGESISHEGLRSWWQAYKKGVYILRKDDNIIGAIGIWPLKKATFEKLIKGKIDEVELTANDISRRAAGGTHSYWYFADIVLEKQYRKTPERLALFLMEETLRQWLSNGGLASRVHVCALGFEGEGIKLLKRFNFEFPEGEPVATRTGKPAYMRTLTVEEIHLAVNYLCRLRNKHTEVEEKDKKRVEEKGRKQTKILFLAASPQDSDRLELDKEIEAIDQALQNSKYRDSFDINQHWAVSVDRLAYFLRRHKPDIVHFSAHGSAANEIMLEDSGRISHPVTAQELGKLFFLLKDDIRCVILNACYSEVQAQAIAAHIDCVVGMSEPICDDSAIKFAASFYGALGDGETVKSAFEFGRLQIDLENLDGEGVPKLICKKPETETTCFVSEVG